jgi:hypothetical protein
VKRRLYHSFALCYAEVYAHVFQLALNLLVLLVLAVLCAVDDESLANIELADFEADALLDREL